jgi:hypothetical protein
MQHWHREQAALINNIDTRKTNACLLLHISRSYVVFVVWRVSCFVVLYHHAREQFSEANFIWVAYTACGLGGFFIMADFPLNIAVAKSNTHSSYVAGNVALQVPCIVCSLWAAYLTWPSSAQRAYFAEKRKRIREPASSKKRARLPGTPLLGTPHKRHATLPLSPELTSAKFALN